MKYLIILMVLTVSVVGFMPASVTAKDWSIKAGYTESCSCNPTCPCLFGSPSTLGYCEGNNLIEIHEGHYGEVNLDGISVVTAFSLGKWLKVYVSDNATEEQAKAALELLKLKETFGMIYSGGSTLVSLDIVPVTIEKTSANIRFSIPDSEVEIELMKGLNGNPIRIQNLPVPFMREHTQYKSKMLTHTSDGRQFSHSGTNGLTSSIEASGI